MDAERFGEQIPHCEPPWYQGAPSPYYQETHRAYRKICRDFMTEHVEPYIEDWVESETGYPKKLHEDAFKAGVTGCIFPSEYGGDRGAKGTKDPFHEHILWDEIGRMGGGIFGQTSINSMALPPIIVYGSDYVKGLVVNDVVQGRKDISLAISEPVAGSDVANISTTAVLDPSGEFYIVNGQKKWITGGHMADFFTLTTRTGGAGAQGVSLLLMPAWTADGQRTPGLNIRKLPMQFDSAHGTTFITMDDVKIPAKNIIGKEGQGFKQLLLNFNHERWEIAVSTIRGCRRCYEEAFKYAMKRKTFGQLLIEHQAIRFKFAEMARQIEAIQAQCESITYLYSVGVPDIELGSQCALLKVNSTRCHELCAREASQIFGGSSLVKEGQGKLVERMYRDVRAGAIPGGSEEIMLDLAGREALKRARKLQQSGQAKL